MARDRDRRTIASKAARGEGSQTIALDAVGVLLPERRAEMIVRIVQSFAARACLHLSLGDECGVLAAFPEAFADNQVIVYHLADVDAALPPDAFSIVDLIMFDKDAVMNESVSREPVYALKANLLPALADAMEAGAWFPKLARPDTRTGTA